MAAQSPRSKGILQSGIHSGKPGFPQNRSLCFIHLRLHWAQQIDRGSISVLASDKSSWAQIKLYCLSSEDDCGRCCSANRKALVQLLSKDCKVPKQSEADLHVIPCSWALVYQHGIKESKFSAVLQDSATGTATVQVHQAAQWCIHRRVKAAPHKSRQQC